MKITATIDVTEYLQKSLPEEFSKIKSFFDSAADSFNVENNTHVEVDITKYIGDRHMDAMFSLGIKERILLSILLKLGDFK